MEADCTFDESLFSGGPCLTGGGAGRPQRIRCLCAGRGGTCNGPSFKVRFRKFYFANLFLLFLVSPATSSPFSIGEQSWPHGGRGERNIAWSTFPWPTGERGRGWRRGMIPQRTTSVPDWLFASALNILILKRDLRNDKKPREPLFGSCISDTVRTPIVDGLKENLDPLKVDTARSKDELDPKLSSETSPEDLISLSRYC